MAKSSDCVPGNTGQNSQAHHVMDSRELHAGHDMRSMAHTSDQDISNDCCDNECQCAQNACASSMLMIANTTESQLYQLNNAAEFKLDQFPHSLIVSTLYRPPITC